MRRISVIGNCGNGKTTLARELADGLGLTHIEMDGLFHQQDWTPTPPAEFQAKLTAAMAAADAATDGWTMCGNYQEASARVGQSAADTIVWLDLSRRVIMPRVIKRTLRRAVKREELWNGNREPLTNFCKWDPQENIIRWTWIKQAEYRANGNAAMNDGTWAHATVHHLQSPAEVEQFKMTAAL